MRSGLQPHIVCWTLFALLWSGVALAELAFIPLRHSTPESLIPIVQPFLEPGETIIAGRNELIVHASKASLQTVQRIVDQYDQAARRLMIYVRADESSSRHNRGIDGQVQAQIGPNSSSTTIQGQAHIYDNRLHRNQNNEQFIQVLDGHPAYISYGTSTPTTGLIIQSTPRSFTLSQDTQYHDDTQGFVVTPRLVGDEVLLEIRQWADQVSQRSDGVHSVSGATSTIRAPLNSWVTLGGIREGKRQDREALLAHSISTQDSVRNIELKIVPLDPSQ